MPLEKFAYPNNKISGSRAADFVLRICPRIRPPACRQAGNQFASCEFLGRPAPSAHRPTLRSPTLMKQFICYIPPLLCSFGVPRIELGLPAPKAGVLPVYYTPVKFRRARRTRAVDISRRASKIG